MFGRRDDYACALREGADKQRVESSAARDALAVLPAGGIATYWLLTPFFSGGYFPSAWYPAAIATVVLAALVVGAGWRLPRGAGGVAFGLLAAFTGWTLLSIAWAAAGGQALEAGNKLIFALATTFVFALTPWTRARASWLLGYLAAGIAIGSAVPLISAAMATNPTESFLGGRYSDPLGYAGASAAFSAISIWLSLSFAIRRELPTWIRASAFGVAAMQVELALLPQSRGVLIGLVCALILFVALAHSRSWATLFLLFLAVVVAATIAPILDVYTVATGSGSISDALSRAAWRLPVILVAGGAVGALLTFLERKRPELLPAAAAGRWRLPIATVTGVLVVIVVVAFGGRISDGVSSRWDEFKNGTVSEESANHLTALQDSGRYDYWRVAVDAFDEKPITGIGAGNYQDAYTLHRHEAKPSRYAHNFWLRVLSETGIVGLLLIVGSLGTALVTLFRSRGGLSPPVQCLLAGAAAASIQVFAHASFDWIEEFPVNLGIALGVLFLACRLTQPPAGTGRRTPWSMVATGVAAVAALILLAPAYLSVRYAAHAEKIWPTEPAAAYAAFDRAGDLNPLSGEPHLKAGEIALVRGERERARHEMEKAISLEDDWYPHFELAIIASENGERKLAIAEMKFAKRMDPLDELEKYSLYYLEEGHTLTRQHAQAQIEEESSDRLFHIRQESELEELREEEEREHSERAAELRKQREGEREYEEEVKRREAEG
jgi:tetratricopeptide (TPR) repeat protein